MKIKDISTTFLMDRLNIKSTTKGVTVTIARQQPEPQPTPWFRKIVVGGCHDMNSLLCISLFAGIAFAIQTTEAKSSDEPAIYNVRDYGAAGDGKTIDTKAIQAAVDKCTKAGGGHVVLGKGGTFLYYLACDDVLVDGITVENSGWVADGIDIDGCHRVRIANSSFKSTDDGICLKR